MKFGDHEANNVKFMRVKFQGRSLIISGDISGTGDLIFRLRESKVSGTFISFISRERFDEFE